MTRQELLEKITAALSDIVDDPALKLTEETTAEDVADWDSVNHVKLIIALEGELKIRFEPDEISGLENVGGMIDLIQKKLQ
jgi:acyl carrier protein